MPELVMNRNLITPAEKRILLRNYDSVWNAPLGVALFKDVEPVVKLVLPVNDHPRPTWYIALLYPANPDIAYCLYVDGARTEYGNFNIHDFFVEVVREEDFKSDGRSLRHYAEEAQLGATA